MAFKQIVFLILVSNLKFAESAPIINMFVYQNRRLPNHYGIVALRPLPLGDWINSSSWFPIEINVPDTIGSIAEGLSGFANSITNGFNSVTAVAQRIPFIHRLTSPSKPRIKYFILVPPQKQFNSFEDEVEMFLHYP